MKTPRPYISYSQLWLYLNDPQKYFLNYILGHKEPANEKMIFGKIFHKAAAEPKFNWKLALKKEGFTSNYQRIIETALPQLPDRTFHEIKLEALHKPINLLSILDGVDFEEDVFDEYKTGHTWTQQEADESLQITFYCFVYYLIRHVIPKTILHSVKMSSGDVKHFKTRRYKKDFKDLQEKIVYAHSGIVNQVWTP